MRPAEVLAVFAITITILLCTLPASADKLDNNRIKAQSALVLEEIIRGISEGDYNLYSRNFSQAMKSAHTREIFLELQKNLQKNLGKFQSMEYIGFLNQSNNLIVIFKARFGKEKDDVEIRLVLEDRDHPQVTGLWFDSPALTRER